MREEGEVLEIKDDLALIKIKRSSACDQCRCCHMADQAEFMSAEASNKAQAKVGDRVIIEIEQREVLAASVIVYIVPLILMIFGYIIGTYLSKVLWKTHIQESGIALGFTFLAFSYLIVMLIEKRASKTRWLQPVVIEVVRQ